MRATESDPRVTELYNESTPFLDAYPDYDLALLPTWVRENIEAARVYGGSKRGVVLPDGRKYHLDNKLNDLTGREWTFFINSVFSTHYPTRGEEAYAHHIRKIGKDLYCFGNRAVRTIPISHKTRRPRFLVGSTYCQCYRSWTAE